MVCGYHLGLNEAPVADKSGFYRQVELPELEPEPAVRQQPSEPQTPRISKQKTVKDEHRLAVCVIVCVKQLELCLTSFVEY